MNLLKKTFLTLMLCGLAVHLGGPGAAGAEDTPPPDEGALEAPAPAPIPTPADPETSAPIQAPEAPPRPEAEPREPDAPANSSPRPQTEMADAPTSGQPPQTPAQESPEPMEPLSVVSQTQPPAGTRDGAKAQGPISISTDRMEVDDQAREVSLVGNVNVTWQGFVLTADKALVNYREIRGSSGDEEALEQVVTLIQALGNVKITLDSRVALADKAVYDAAAKVITLTGSPRVWRGKDYLTGDRIKVYLEEDRSVVEGGPNKKVMATFYQGGGVTPEEEEANGKPGGN